MRIAIPAGSDVNKYGASPFPRATLAYAASTANDISADAFARLSALVGNLPAGALNDEDFYAERLDLLRCRLRAAYALPATTDIVFAPSGTDLEFLALALSAAGSGKAVRNILLGQDEVGSGCALAAAGRHFAADTVLRPSVVKGTPLRGLEQTEIVNLPLRDECGAPRGSAALAADIDRSCSDGRAHGKHMLVHVVHGSKTGLLLPHPEHLEDLRCRHSHALSVVVDACQARLSGESIAAYLRSGAIVLLTGSKFIGGPPFAGMALVPAQLAPSRALAPGLCEVLRRAELPAAWNARAAVSRGANPGLLLRLEAALFELERFVALDPDQTAPVIAAFGHAVRALVERLGVTLVDPSLGDGGLHESTLATLDLSGLPDAPDFATAQLWQRVLAARGMRVGQPVKCIRRADGWAGTLRLSLSMPLIVECARLDGANLARRFADHMARIACVLEAAQRRVAI